MKTNNILSIEQFKIDIGTKSRLIGVDPGSKNIGISICDENKIVATPYKTIKKTSFKFLLDELNEIILENNIKGVVVGNPINMDGSEGSSSQSAIDLAKKLSKYITIPITIWDERLSSEGSFNITRELSSNVSNKMKKIHKNAAAFILQGAIDFLSN